MITAQNFIQRLKEANLFYSTAFVYPVLTVNLVHEDFDEDDHEASIELIETETGLIKSDVHEAMANSVISYRCYSSTGNVPPADDVADHWMALLTGSPLSRASSTGGNIRSVHFYGYKGGQARSTTLAVMAKRLADLGKKVLIIDADIEAPSLNILFDTAIPRLSGSLMGACGQLSEINPIGAYRGSQGGYVDLLGCRPTGPEYDLDFQAFALTSSLDPNLLRRGFSRIRHVASRGKKWDCVLIDHRTGIAPSVIPVLSEFPGTAVIALRPDLLSTPALRIAEMMLSAYPQYPGAFVSFSLDPEERRELSSQERLLRERFLSVLAKVIEKYDGSSEAIDPLSLEHHYINWFYDRAFIDQPTPDFERLTKDNQESISDLIQIIGLDQDDVSVSVVPAIPGFGASAPVRVPSGASDAGWFIETREISKLMQESSAFSYIFGRKGTGKTRIYREMHQRGKGSPVLAAADYSHGGLRAQSLLAQDLLSKVDGDFEAFWWMLIELSITHLDGVCDASVQELVENMALGFKPSPSKIYNATRSLLSQKTLLIDGVETAVSSRDTKRFVEALFRVLSTIQNDPGLNEKVQFKLFVRPDLSVGIQNVEQQTAGRKLDLRWNEASIFNYMLAEIGRKDWFNQTFPAACTEIADLQVLIQEGALDREIYEKILLSIFPAKIRRNNLLTMTFLRTYFSDSVSDSADQKSSFYPRVVGSFLDHVERICRSDVNSAIDASGRVSHAILVEAFTLATDEFINEIKQELYFALELAPDTTENQKLVDELISSLSGLQTPFYLDSCVEKLQAKLGSHLVGDRALRDAFRQMREMGIFEAHPVDSSKWRAGRLFKEALRMKYVR